MSINTQGQDLNGVPQGPSFSRRQRPRRSVVNGAVVSLAVGLVLGFTVLPSMANASVVRSSVRLATGSTTVTSTTSTSTSTTTTTAPHAAHRVKSPHVAAHVTSRVAAHVVTRPHTSTTPTTAPHSSPTSNDSTTSATTTPTTVAPVTTTTVRPAAPARTAVTSISNPSSNIAPNPNFLAAGHCSFANGVWSCDNPCIVGSATALSWPAFTNGVACTNYVLAAINNARSAEGVGPMVLPTNWFSLSVPQQLFVVADLERTARGLPAYVGLNAALTTEAQHAAQAYTDPGIAAGFPIANDAQGSPGMGGAWSGGYSVLAADYVWMYDDGWASAGAFTSNIACTSARAAGCWAHRDELLGSDPGFNPGVGLQCTNCEMGTGFAMVNGKASYVDLVEIPRGALPPMTFTWANNVLPYLG